MNLENMAYWDAEGKQLGLQLFSKDNIVLLALIKRLHYSYWKIYKHTGLSSHASNQLKPVYLSVCG